MESQQTVNININFDDKAQDFENFRKLILDQFHSQVLTHAGYILALTVGALTIISQYYSFFSNGSAATIFIFFLIMSLITGYGFYLICRLFYWNCLVQITLTVTQKEFANYKEDENHKDENEVSKIGKLYRFIASKIKDTLAKENAEAKKYKTIQVKLAFLASSKLRYVCFPATTLIALFSFLTSYFYLFPEIWKFTYLMNYLLLFVVVTFVIGILLIIATYLIYLSFFKQKKEAKQNEHGEKGHRSKTLYLGTFGNLNS